VRQKSTEIHANQTSVSMKVADKSAAKISRNSRKLKQSIMGIADKSAAKISRNSRKLKQSINEGSRQKCC
jgi:hypothetical protein